MNESVQFAELVEEYRERCLWFFKADMPTERDAQLYALDCIERYGERNACIQTRELKQWLLQHSSEAFAIS